MNYKRQFGPVAQTAPEPALAQNKCRFCGRDTVVNVPVFIRLEASGPATEVCRVMFCARCREVVRWKAWGPDGQEKEVPAFFVSSCAPGKKLFTAWRDFVLPAELYQRDGKADVGAKVRLVATLVRLVLEDPMRRDFKAEEVIQECEVSQ